MSEGIEHTAEKILDGIKEKFTDNASKLKSVRFAEDDNPVSDQINKLFGRQKSIYKVFGGGKSADVLLWRDKKISSGVLVGATAVWVFFEWLDYHFLTLACFALVIGMVIQLVWSNASGLLNGSPSSVPRLVLPEELFAKIGASIGIEVNRFLAYIQDIASGRDLKQFIMIVAGLWAAAVVGSWCNFLTILYIGFVAANTLPVLYERYEDQVDNFVYNLHGQLQHLYRKLDEGVLSKIPKGNLKQRKSE